MFSTIRDPENHPNKPDKIKTYFSANQMIDLSGTVAEAPTEKTKSARFEVDEQYEYKVKLVKMNINQNDDSGGVIKIATTNVSISKHPAGSYASTSVEFNKKKAMFNAAFGSKDDQATKITRDDTVLFFDVCIGHTYAKEVSAYACLFELVLILLI